MGISQKLLETLTIDEQTKVERVAETLKFTADHPLTKTPPSALSHFPPLHQKRIYWIVTAGTDLFKAVEPSATLHAWQTWELSKKLAEVSGTYQDFYTLCLGAVLHDLGKIFVPTSVLGKPARLNNDERNLVRKHALLGAILVERLGPFFARASGIVLAHHEEWGGGGYPQGLLREETPVEARIVHLADVVSALSVDRVYRKKLAPDAVRDVILRMQRDRQAFDPNLIRYLDELI